MKQIIDQAAHFLIALVALLPAALWPNAVTFALAGGMTGIVREVTEEGTPVTMEKVRAALGGWSWIDTSFWALGGFIAGQAA